MHYNAKVKSTAENGASATYTLFIEANSEAEAKEIAEKSAQNEPLLSKNTKSIEVWFVTDQELEQERWEYAKDKAEFEYQCGGYND